MHERAKHKEHQNPPTDESESETGKAEMSIKCDQCEFIATNKEHLKKHINLKDDHETESSEIKLEVFAIFDFGMDVYEARNAIIDKLNAQDGVDKLLKVYVDKNETFMDVDKVFWNSADDTLATKSKTGNWKKQSFIKNILEDRIGGKLVKLLRGKSVEKILEEESKNNIDQK